MDVGGSFGSAIWSAFWKCWSCKRNLRKMPTYTHTHTHQHTYTFHIHAWISFTGYVSKSVYAPPLCFSAFSLNVSSHCFKRTTIAIFVSSSVDGILSRFEEARWITIFDRVRVVTIHIHVWKQHFTEDDREERKKEKNNKRKAICFIFN